jgi:hypothetical protein
MNESPLLSLLIFGEDENILVTCSNGLGIFQHAVFITSWIIVPHPRDITYVRNGMEACGKKRGGHVTINGVESVRLPAKIFLKDMY